MAASCNTLIKYKCVICNAAWKISPIGFFNCSYGCGRGNMINSPFILVPASIEGFVGKSLCLSHYFLILSKDRMPKRTET